MDIVTTIGLVLVGCFNLIVSCMRDDPKSKKQERRRKEMEAETEYGHETEDLLEKGGEGPAYGTLRTNYPAPQ